jgi:hypothetical protein
MRLWQAWLIGLLCVWGVLDIVSLIGASLEYGDLDITVEALEDYDRARPDSSERAQAAREILRQAEAIVRRPRTISEAVGMRLGELLTFGFGTPRSEQHRGDIGFAMVAMWAASLVGAPLIARRMKRRPAIWFILALIPMGLPALFAVTLAERPPLAEHGESCAIC